MNLKEYIVEGTTSLLEVMNKINDNGRGIVFVCRENKLTGAITDGNIRRYIMRGGKLDGEAKDVANGRPKFLYQSSSQSPMEFMMKEGIISVPILNEKDEITAIKFADSKSAYGEYDLNLPVIIMAGGKGIRLEPFTNVLPKPLIPVGEKTITEHIMDKFLTFGCSEFNMVVNYKKNLIMTYFNGESPYAIKFTEEDDFFGTAGGLKYLEETYNSTMFITNCDIIIDENYGDMVAHHKKEKSIITMITSLEDYTIPYGTISLDEEGQVKDFVEKPNYSFLISTGMYLIEPEFLNYIPKNEFIDMPQVIEECIKSGEKVGVYPISSNSWYDMGQMDELKKMKENIYNIL